MKFFALVAVLFVAIGCASDRKREAEIQEKIAHEPVPTHKELNREVHELIEKSKHLSDTEKKNLSSYIEEVRAKNHKIHDDSLKLRQLMITELLKEKPNRKLVGQIRKDIHKMEKERVNNMFKAIDKVTTEVSRDPQCEAYVNHMLAIDRPVR